MSVSDGQPVSAAITNPAFLKPDVDDFTVSRLGMERPLAASPSPGYFVQDIQRYINNVAQVIGLVYTGNFSAEADATGNTYGSTSTIITNGNTFKAAIISIANAFSAAGHAHTGSGADGAQIAIANTTGILAISRGGTNSASVVSAPAATSWAGWDANKNLSANNHIEGYATTATAAGTTTLTVGSAYQQYFTGSTTQTVVLPVATTLVNGFQFSIINTSSGIVTVQTSGSNTIQAMAANSSILLTCINTAGGTGTASWSWIYGPTLASVLPVPSGGTGAATLAAHGVVVGAGTSAVVVTTAGTAGQILTSNGPSADPSFQAAPLASTKPYIPPTVQKFTSGTTYTVSQVFIVTAANATAGATYTNNSFTFTVSATISAGTQLVTTTTGGSPLTSGTLTKSGGTGDATITFSSFASPLYLSVKAVGGGAGGSGSGTSPAAATAGGNTTFGSTIIVANGGAIPSGSAGGAGGTATLGTGIFGLALQGGQGGSVSTLANSTGGNGGQSLLGGGASGGTTSGAGNGGALYGSGGGGAGSGGVGGDGAGGGAGGYVDAVYTLTANLVPASTFAYTIGAAGGAGGAGGSGFAGGVGAQGIIVIEERYQ